MNLCAVHEACPLIPRTRYPLAVSEAGRQADKTKGPFFLRERKIAWIRLKSSGRCIQAQYLYSLKGTCKSAGHSPPPASLQTSPIGSSALRFRSLSFGMPPDICGISPDTSGIRVRTSKC